MAIATSSLKVLRRPRELKLYVSATGATTVQNLAYQPVDEVLN
jgi:hypothetical protein